MEETKEDLHKWREIPYSCIGRVNIVKVTICPELIQRVSAIPARSQEERISYRKKQADSKIDMGKQRNQKKVKQF